MEDSVEIVIEKLLHVTKDIVPKVILYWWKDFILSALASFPCLIHPTLCSGFK